MQLGARRRAGEQSTHVARVVLSSLEGRVGEGMNPAISCRAMMVRIGEVSPGLMTLTVVSRLVVE
jgi:hypothetical protein